MTPYEKFLEQVRAACQHPFLMLPESWLREEYHNGTPVEVVAALNDREWESEMVEDAE